MGGKDFTGIAAQNKPRWFGCAPQVASKFKMRSDIQSYHLGGMGCANGVISVNLINDLLKVRNKDSLGVAPQTFACSAMRHSTQTGWFTLNIKFPTW